MKDKLIISAYGSHNAAISMYYKGEYTVIEVERWLNSKNIGLTNYMPSKHPQVVFDEITDYLLSKTDRSDVDVLITGYLGKDVKPKFYVKETIGCDHHTAHAATAFYQSPYKEALIFTFDGGGDGGFFNVYTANRTGGIKLIDRFNQDLGFPYMVVCDYLKDIKKEALTIGNLVYAGKVMGLCSYGKVREEWIPYFDAYYDKFNYFGSSYQGGAETRFNALTTLFREIGADDFNFETSRYEGQFAWDIAATSQQAFENQFFKYAQPYLDQYPDMPVALAGGCALNVLLNTKLLKLRNNKVFVPPNVSDCGISVGGLLWYNKPEGQVDLTYSGTPILDKNQFGTYIQESDLTVHENVSIDEVAKYIAEGNIVGVIQGNSEHGSRALGNRSIICNPVGNMKDVLNNKVKHREWYRPFAPIVRLEDCPKYFEFDEGVESRHMVFVADVREEWREKLPAITHEDNTARLQTVTKAQNSFIYDLITEFEKYAGHGVILNTSFNVDGKPILTRLSDAFKILRDTQLDAVYYEGKIITKTANNTFKKMKEIEALGALTDEVTLYLLSFEDAVEAIDADISKIKALLDDTKKTVIVIPEYNLSTYLKNIPESDTLKYYTVVPKHHYYHERMKGKAGLSATSTTVEYAKYLKLFWARDAMVANLFRTQFHLFANLRELSVRVYPHYSRDIDVISKYVAPDSEVIITAKSELPIMFDEEYIEKKFRVTEPVTKIPTAGLFYGNIENMTWFFSNYEGMFLWYIGMDQFGEDYDYLLSSYLENTYRYRFWDAG